MVYRVSERFRHVRVHGVARWITNLNRENRCRPGHTSHADTVVALRRGGAGNGGAVPVIVSRIGVVGVKIVAGEELTREVRLVWRDTGIADRNGCCWIPGANIPCVQRLNLGEMPFVTGCDVRVVGHGTGGSDRVFLREFYVGIVAECIHNKIAFCGRNTQDPDVELRDGIDLCRAVDGE